MRYTLKDYTNIHEFIATKEYIKALNNEDINYLISLIEGCEFEIEVNPNGTLSLRDLQGVYLGGVESYENFQDILCVADRLQYSYFHDYYGIDVW